MDILQAMLKPDKLIHNNKNAFCNPSLVQQSFKIFQKGAILIDMRYK